MLGVVPTFTDLNNCNEYSPKHLLIGAQAKRQKLMKENFRIKIGMDAALRIRNTFTENLETHKRKEAIENII